MDTSSSKIPKVQASVEQDKVLTNVRQDVAMSRSALARARADLFTAKADLVKCKEWVAKLELFNAMHKQQYNEEVAKAHRLGQIRKVLIRASSFQRQELTEAREHNRRLYAQVIQLCAQRREMSAKASAKINILKVTHQRELSKVNTKLKDAILCLEKRKGDDVVVSLMIEKSLIALEQAKSATTQWTKFLAEKDAKIIKLSAASSSKAP